MLAKLRRHRRRLTHSLLSLLALTWLAVAAQPCLAGPAPDPEPAAIHHHAAPAHGEHHGHAAPAPVADENCSQGDCALFTAVEGSAANKPASPEGEPVQALPVALLSWLLPPEVPVRAVPVQPLHEPAVAVPEPPILAFRVLLI